MNEHARTRKHDSRPTVFGYKKLMALEDWRETVGASKWKPTRSAYELAHMWHASPSMPPVVRDAFQESGIDMFKSLRVGCLYVEHPTFLDTLKAPSCTDIMLHCRTKDSQTLVIGVEGKTDEPFAERVRDWVSFGFALASAVVLGAGAVAKHGGAEERATIQQVINGRAKAREDSARWVGFGATRHRVLVVSSYITELGSIEPTACPKKFRDAWMDYVEKWERKKDSVIQQQNQLDERADRFQAGIGAQTGMTIEHKNLHDAAERLEKLDTDEAWLAVKRGAMDYGVFVPADPF